MGSTICERWYQQFIGTNGAPNHLQLIVPQALRECPKRAAWMSSGWSPWRRENTRPTQGAILLAWYLDRCMELVSDLWNLCLLKKSHPQIANSPGNHQGWLSYANCRNGHTWAPSREWRWMEACPIPSQEATTVATKLVDEFFCQFSIPEQIQSDQRKQFESRHCWDM